MSILPPRLTESQRQLLQMAQDGKIQRTPDGWVIGGQMATGTEVRALSKLSAYRLIQVDYSPDWSIVARTTASGDTYLRTVR